MLARPAYHSGIMFVVFDLDGTLSLDAHRLPLIKRDPPDYAAYEDACAGDPPCDAAVRALFAHMAAGHRVEVWTGRSGRVYGLTCAWMRAQGIPRSRLVRMREPGDNTTPSVELKRAWFNALPPRERPQAAYDDRPEAAAMWASCGVLCFQLVRGL